jgi:Ca-activated chloride channel family protein
MKLSTLLDVDLVAVENDDEVTVLVEILAPTPATTTVRQPATVQVVLDRSGSMSGDRLEHAKRALFELVDRLEPTDNFGIVAFDDSTQVVVPAGPLTDKARAKAAIAAIYPGGSTDLFNGYLRGLQEAQRVASPSGATVLLISDGHANAGITDHASLGKVATGAAGNQVTTSTIGMGLGYDEQLLSAIATGGRGNEHFAEDPDTAAAVIAGEVDGLLTQVAQACSLRVTLAPEVKGAMLLNQLPAVGLEDGFMVELGALYAGECRKLVIRLVLPGLAALGLHQVATLALTHVSMPDLVQHTTTLPVTVNVVPGDQAAGRVRAPEVTSEALFQETQKVKREAADLLSQGRVEDAQRLLGEAGATLGSAAAGLDDALAAPMMEELRIVQSLAEEAQYDSFRAGKALSSTSSRNSRTRGRRNSGTFLLLVPEGYDDSAGLLLEDWEIARCTRIAPATAALVAGSWVEATVLAQIAAELGFDHPLHDFFAQAGAKGRLMVRRA